ncbi:PDDEXK nuclease domain-containing protein [Hymenobacter sp. UYP22]|uniref:PDDEXK nuclease domain-containing protein n=1 Tax=Hymenobacter sp. UYP22 TaxID=3156348 RepID=UPI003399AA91
MNVRKLQHILQLPAAERYGYLIRKATDYRALSLLGSAEGVIMLSDDSRSQIITVWPKKEFAHLHLTSKWAGYQTEKMDLEDFLEWLDELQTEMIQIVLVDLKIGAFSHADAGPMNAYLHYYRKHEMSASNNPPIGLILCTQKNESLVRYATTRKRRP